MTATISADTPAAGPSASDTPPAAVERVPETMTLIVTAIDRPTPDIRTFHLAAVDGAALPAFVAGSHLVVHTPSGANAYSLTGDGTHPTSYSISVLRIEDGTGGSRWLHSDVAVGDGLVVTPPRSAFAPIARARKHLLVAGGIGVTPIVSHLRAARRWAREVQVLYTFREGHGAHVADIEGLAGADAEYYTSRADFSARLATTLAEQPLGTHLYVCGPATMIDHVVDAAHAAGWPDSRIHFERFGIDALDAGEDFRVEATVSNKSIDVPSGTSMLEALETNGISVPFRCRQGVCGECMIPLNAGDAIHRDLYLTDTEKSAGESIMPCVSRAGAGCTLEVPL